MSNLTMNIHEEINQNMTVSAGGGFELNNDELELLRNNQGWANSRANRRKPSADKTGHRVHAQDWVNGANLMQPGNSNIVVQQGSVDENREISNANSQNNKNLSAENLDTIRENIRNSQESVRKSSSENILEIEENMRKNSIKSSNSNANMADVDIANVQLRHPSKLGLHVANKAVTESTGTLSGSTVDMYQSPTSPTAKDAHTAFIDLSNNCRQFYFSHLKNAEAIKQSIRTQKHNRALDKVHGRSASGIDNAMDRLRAEMADLMDQDLSLMSQLLTLNDKIEEIKNHVRNSADTFSQSFSYLSTGDVTDNEYSDLEESGIFNRDFSIRRHSAPQTTPVHSVISTNTHSAIPEAEDDIHETQKGDEEPRKVEPSEREIIVYRKKKARRKSRSDITRSRNNSRNNSSAEDSEATDEESDETEETEEGSHSDTESTISCPSDSDGESELTETDTKDASENADSGVQSPTQSKEPEPSKPVKGGVSRNRFFLKFHKKNGASSAMTGGNSVLTLQGHHIPLEKYYIPQGLVYLKHTESDNVFCQFSH